MAKLFANSGDPDQMSHSAASVLSGMATSVDKKNILLRLTYVMY